MKKHYLCAFIHGKTNNATIVLSITTTINFEEKLVTIIHLQCLHFFPDSTVFSVKKAPKRHYTTTQSVLSFHMYYKVKMLVCLHMALQEQVGAKCVIATFISIANHSRIIYRIYSLIRRTRL